MLVEICVAFVSNTIKPKTESVTPRQICIIGQ